MSIDKDLFPKKEAYDISDEYQQAYKVYTGPTPSLPTYVAPIRDNSYDYIDLVKLLINNDHSVEDAIDYALKILDRMPVLR